MKERCRYGNLRLEERRVPVREGRPRLPNLGHVSYEDAFDSILDIEEGDVNIITAGPIVAVAEVKKTEDGYTTNQYLIVKRPSGEVEIKSLGTHNTTEKSSIPVDTDVEVLTR